MADKIRVDKWLWTVRIFKSRSLAATACRGGNVKIKDKNVKPSQLVSREDHIRVHKGGYNFEFIVKDILKTRVSATLAAPCYENITPEAELNKFKNWFIGKARNEVREKGSGRPTKRERREIEDYKWEQLMDFLDLEE